MLLSNSRKFCVFKAVNLLSGEFLKLSFVFYRAMKIGFKNSEFSCSHSLAYLPFKDKPSKNDKNFKETFFKIDLNAV